MKTSARDSGGKPAWRQAGRRTPQGNVGCAQEWSSAQARASFGYLHMSWSHRGGRRKARSQSSPRGYEFPPRTIANGSGLAQGTSFVSENHEPAALVPN